MYVPVDDISLLIPLFTLSPHSLADDLSPHVLASSTLPSLRSDAPITQRVTAWVLVVRLGGDEIGQSVEGRGGLGTGCCEVPGVEHDSKLGGAGYGLMWDRRGVHRALVSSLWSGLVCLVDSFSRPLFFAFLSVPRYQCPKIPREAAACIAVLLFLTPLASRLPSPIVGPSQLGLVPPCLALSRLVSLQTKSLGFDIAETRTRLHRAIQRLNLSSSKGKGRELSRVLMATRRFKVHVAMGCCGRGVVCCM